MAPAPAPLPTGSPAAIYAPVALVAELLGITERAVRDRARERDWRVRMIAADGGGRRLEVAIEALAPEVQVRALARMGNADCGTRNDEVTPTGSDYERASGTERAEADRRLTILHQVGAYLAANPTIVRSAAIRDAVAGLRVAGIRISAASYYAYAAAYAARGLDGLVPSYGGGRQTGVSPQWRSLFLQCWGCEQQPTVTTAYKASLILAGKAGLPAPPPTLAQIRYLVDHLSAEERILLREGPKAVRSQLLPYIARDWDGCLPLEWWCMDHTPLDILAMDEDTGTVCRPYLTTLMDMGTRRGAVTVCRVPNQNTVLWTLAKAILAWGNPGNLYVDNGKDFRAAAVTGGKRRRHALHLDEGRVRSLCDRLAIQAHFATNYNAQAKPIERWHRTIEQNVAVFFESYVGNRPDKKPEALKDVLKAGDVPTFREVERVVTGWIEGTYHQTPHAGLHGQTPDQVWAARIGQVQVVQRTVEELKYLLLKTPKHVTVSRYQIRLYGRCYEAAPDTPDCLFGYHGREVVPHVDPRDITRVFLTLPDDTPIGWVIERRLAAIGPAGEDVIAASKREQRKVRMALRTYHADVAAGIVEPDRVARHAQAAQARLDGKPPVGALSPTAVAKAKVIQIPLMDATRAAAAMAATPPAAIAPPPTATPDDILAEPPAPRRAAVAGYHDTLDDLLEG